MRADERDGGGKSSLRLLVEDLDAAFDTALEACLWRMPSCCKWLLLRRMFACLSSSMSAIECQYLL